MIKLTCAAVGSAQHLPPALPPFADAGFHITVVMIDNMPDIAIQRSASRFQAKAQYAQKIG